MDIKFKPSDIHIDQNKRRSELFFGDVTFAVHDTKVFLDSSNFHRILSLLAQLFLEYIKNRDLCKISSTVLPEADNVVLIQTEEV